MYGKWAVIASIGLTNPIIEADPSEIFKQARELVLERLQKWQQFDEFVSQKRSNTKYFTDKRSNYELYYKVNMLDGDIKEYFLV